MAVNATPDKPEKKGGIDEILAQSANMTAENRDTVLAEGYSYLFEKIFGLIGFIGTLILLHLLSNHGKW
jgi:hypothetical protein